MISLRGHIDSRHFSLARGLRQKIVLNVSTVSGFLSRILVAVIFCATLSHAENVPSASLKFQSAPDGGFTFDTGTLRGTLRPGGKSDGLLNVVHVPNGAVLDKSKGFFGFYRVFTSQKRFGVGAWDWPSTARLKGDGSVEAIWPGATNRPFEIRANYKWAEPTALDLEVSVSAQETLPNFEMFLASYFNEPFTNASVLAKEEQSPAPQLIEAAPPFGMWQCFPRNDDAMKIVQDGRWKYPPAPVDWTMRATYFAAIAVRQNPTTGVCGLVMAPRENCFAVLTPMDGEKHNSLYLSLFGRDVKPGKATVAHARFVIDDHMTAAKAEQIYLNFMQSLHAKSRVKSPRASK